MVKPLYKTTIVIWSERDGENYELSELAREAEDGDAYCAAYRSKWVESPTEDPDWDGTEFFDEGWGDDAEEEATNLPGE